MDPREHNLGRAGGRISFDNLINDLQHHHNDDYNSDYVPDNYNDNDYSPGTRESEYVAKEKEEGMIFTDDDIAEVGV